VPSPQQQRAYEEHVAKRLIIDTFLDALRFFIYCDPTLARWTDNQTLEAFPLPRLPGPTQEYQRLTPFDPSVNEFETELRNYVRKTIPVSSRVLTGRLTMANGTTDAYAGESERNSLITTFVERRAQVTEDIERGATYTVNSMPVTLGNNTLRCGSADLDAILPVVNSTEAEECRSRLRLYDEHLDLYILDRKA
jgi:hypothetical protein